MYDYFQKLQTYTWSRGRSGPSVLVSVVLTDIGQGHGNVALKVRVPTWDQCSKQRPVIKLIIAQVSI